MRIRNVKILVLLICVLTATMVRAQDLPICERALRPASGTQEAPAVAGSGADYLAAWADARSRVYDKAQPSPREEWDVYGSRIGLDGGPDPAGGVPLAPTWLRDESPTVVWNGSEYVVINPVSGWPVTEHRHSEVMFTRVSDAGPDAGTLVPLRSDAIALYGARVVAAWNGSQYLVVIGYRWATSDYPSEATVVRAFLVDAQFNVTHPLFDVSDPSVDSILPSVATDGTSFLITWIAVSNGHQEVRAAVVSSAGDVSRASSALATNTDGFERWPAAAAWNGLQYLVTWSDNSSIFGRFTDAQGTAASDTIAVAHIDENLVFAPSIAWNGSQFLVAFSSSNDRRVQVTKLWASRLRGDASLIDTLEPLMISAAPNERIVSAVAASAERFAVVFTADGDIHSLVVDPAAPRFGPDSLVTRSVGVQSSGRGAFNGDTFGFLWNEDSDVLFGRMTIDGRPQDGPGIKLGSTTSRAIVTNGDIFLSVWQPGPFSFPTPPPLQAARVSSRSQVMDNPPLDLKEGGDLFDSDGSDFIVVTHQVFRDGTLEDRSRLAAYVVTSSGALTSAIALAPAEFSQVPISVAWNGSHYLLVYTQFLGENCYHCFPRTESRAIFLDRAGHTAGESFLIIANAGHVAGGDGRFLVTGFQYELPAYTIKSLYMIVEDTGAMSPPVRIASPPSSTNINAAWTGSEFVIAAGGSLFHIDPTGTLLSETKNAIPVDALEARLIPARGAVPLLIRRIDKLAPAVHAGGIERYFLQWPHAARTRAVR
jgi:hypothetical protein